MEWDIRENVEPQGSGEFWYDLTDGGYVKPELILNCDKQLKVLKDAIDIVSSFEAALEENDLLNEF